MAWYVDTSAFMKLIAAERGSAAMARWARGSSRSGRPALFSSDLLRTEALRAGKRNSPRALVEVRRRLDAVPLISLTSETYDRAGTLDPAILRSLDALHLAAALTAGDDLEGIVSYDERLCSAAALHGVTTVSPGS